MDSFKDILLLLFNKEMRLTHKASLVFLTILAIWVVNNITGFTYYYNTRNRIEQVAALNTLVTNDSTSAEIKRRAQLLQLEILTRKNAPERLINYGGKLYARIKYNLAHNAKQPILRPSAAHVEPESEPVLPRNDLLFMLFSAGMWIAIAFVAIPYCIKEANKQGWGVGLAVFIIIEALIFGCGALFYYGIGLIPMIGGSWWWNYTVAALIQSAFLGILIAVDKAGKKTQQKT